MTATLAQTTPAWLQTLWQRRTWLALAIIVLVAFSIRLRLLQMPLERDEGEYAYAGQLILQGVPPYKLAYNMKLPGTYAAYALIMVLFGQSAAGIHFGLALVNGASIVLVFLIARKLIDDTMGLTAAATFALMSLSPSVLGLAAHATHFVVLPALGGTLLLLNLPENANPPLGSRRSAARRNVRIAIDRKFGLRITLCGLLFGLAFIMKQHGIFFGVFAVLWLLWRRLEHKPRNWLHMAKELSLFGAGFVLPYGLMCLVLVLAGVFHEFVFWTFTYASKYVSAVPMAEGPAILRQPLGTIFSTNPFFWLLPGFACIVMWWEPRLEGHRLFLTLFTLCSIMAVSAGFYFREHYFILLLPALALLNGIGISRAIYLLRHDKTIELFVAVVMLLLFVLGLGTAFVIWSPVWFEEPPERAVERIYGDNLFTATAVAAEYIKQHSSKDAKVAVLGSEPEILFYARRRSATPFIYTYPLMEGHSYALEMQEKMIADIETGKPDYVVFVNAAKSWLPKANSERKLTQWWEGYWLTHYEVEQSLLIKNETGISAPDQPPQKSYLLVLKRKADA